MRPMHHFDHRTRREATVVARTYLLEHYCLHPLYLRAVEVPGVVRAAAGYGPHGTCPAERGVRPFLPMALVAGIESLRLKSMLGRLVSANI